MPIVSLQRIVFVILLINFFYSIFSIVLEATTESILADSCANVNLSLSSNLNDRNITNLQKRYKYWFIDENKKPLPDYGKYVTYRPYDGFNNQAIELQYAIYISWILNRTLIIPNKIATPFHKAKKGSFSDFFDLEDLSKGVSIVYGEDAKLLLQNIGKNVIYNEHRRFTTRIDEDIQSKMDHYNIEEESLFSLIDNYGKSNAKLIVFDYLFGHRNLLVLPFLEEALMTINFYNYLHYREDIFVKALKIVDLLGEDYVAVHIRDTDIRVSENMKHVKFLPKLVDRNTNIYIATDSNSIQETIKNFTQVYDINRLFFWHNFTHLYEDSKEQIKDNDYVGVLEQLVCVMSKRFFGTFRSSFTARTVRMRSQYKQSFYDNYYSGDYS